MKCTPEFNQKTKEMQNELEKLKAQAATAQRNITRQKQLEEQSKVIREKLETGDTSIPVPKSKIVYDKGVKRALAERDQLKKQLDALVKSGEPFKKAAAIQRNIARQKQLDKQISDLRDRIASNDMSRPAKKTAAPTYSEEVLRALVARNRLKNQVELLIAKGDRLNRNAGQKILGIIHDTQMGAILASIHVFKKLGFAVIGGHINSLLTDATVGVVRHLPGIRGIADQAPQYGRGISRATLVARGKGLLEAPKEALNQLWHGQSTRESAFGPHSTGSMTDEFFSHGESIAAAIRTPGFLNKIAETTRTLTGKIGSTHAAEKEFLTQPEYRVGLVRQSKFMVREMEKQGLSPEKIRSVMAQESTLASIATKAVERAYESKMQGKNDFNSSIDRFVSGLHRSNNFGANFAGFLFKQLLPVRKIGVNVAKQGSSLMFGGAKALISGMRKGEMTPERADYIMKNIGQQGTGALLLTVGALYYQQLGGVPGVFSKKEQEQQPTDIKPGETSYLGNEAFHGAPAAMLQIGASMMQIYQKQYGKENGTDLALEMILNPTVNWNIRTIPYTDQAKRMINTLQYGRAQDGGALAGAAQILGANLRSTLIPGYVQQYAAEKDPYKGFRYPRSISEDIKMGIPGWRETVPTTKTKKSSGGGAPLKRTWER